MTKVLNREKIQRMINGGAGGSSYSVSSSAGGGATGNAVSLDYYGQSFTLLYKTVVTVTDPGDEVVSTTTTYTTSDANTLIETGTTTETDPDSGYTTVTVVSLVGPKTIGAGLTVGAVINNGVFATGINGSYVQIGDIQLVYDSANNALKVVKADGTVANFYATGGVSAFGMASGGGGGGGGGIDMDAVWSALAANTNQQINVSHLTDALTGYASTSQLAGYLPLTGGTMTGSITMGTNPIIFSEITSNTWNVGRNSGIQILNTVAASSEGAPDQYSVGLSVSGYYGFQLAAFGGGGRLRYRNTTNGTEFKTWSELASIDDNVASATKLQTARTIWGQSFDGTANVSGSISGATTITASGLITANGGIIIPSGKSLQIGNAIISYDATNDALSISKGLLGYASTSWVQTQLAGYASTSWVQSQLAGYLPLTGGTMTGSITMGTNPIIFSEITSNTWNVGRNSGIQILNTVAASSEGAPDQYSVGLSVSGYYGFQLAAFGGGGRLRYRNTTDGTEFKTWSELASIDDNVASATKLQTARTIWGQSFDGTANVSGSITGATTITASGLITANGGIIIPSGKSLQIGNVLISYDATNDALSISKGLYSLGFVSALGLNSSGGGGGGGIDMEVVWAALATSSNEQINASHLADALAGYALTSQIPTNNNQLANGAGYVTASALNGYALTSQIPTNNNQLANGAGYITGTVLSSTLEDYVTNGSLSNTLSGYVTATSLTNTLSGYVTATSLTNTLSNYGTKTWISNNYLGINANAASATKLQTARTIWGQSFDGTADVSGSISGATSIELSSSTPFIDFHYNNASIDYTSRLIAWESGVLSLETGVAKCGFAIGDGIDGSFLQVGNARLVWDSTNNAIKVINDDGTAANFYATGGVAALGLSAGTSVDSMTFNYLTVNKRMTLKSEVRMASYLQIMSTSNENDAINMFDGTQSSKINYQNYQYIQFDNIGVVGTDYSYDESWWIDPDGCAKFSRVYLDSTRYLYISGGSLKYYNGSSTITIA